MQSPSTYCFIGVLFVAAFVAGAFAEMNRERATVRQLESVINCVAEIAAQDEATNPAEALRIRKAIRRGLESGKAVPLPKVEQLLMRDMSKG
jgi:hypothetical protein